MMQAFYPTEYMHLFLTDPRVKKEMQRMSGLFGTPELDKAFKGIRTALTYCASLVHPKQSVGKVCENLGILDDGQIPARIQEAFSKFSQTCQEASERALSLGATANAVGMIYPRDRLVSKSALLYHFLTGLECLFIFKLMTRDFQKRYGYKVISYQYDGLVTVGEIPEQAVHEVKENHPAKDYIKLVEKPFVSERELLDLGIILKAHKASTEYV
jgi:hypothetical protein